MKVRVAYVAVSHSPAMPDFAARFAATYNQFPPGADHSTTIVCNGGPLKADQQFLFSGIPGVEFYPRQNDDGYDISGYQDIASHTNADMLVCLGESVYFHRAGWLKRMVEAWEKYGPGMYGFFSSHNVRAHMNTTAFVIDPKMLLSYPLKIRDKPSRYEFEHGSDSFWRYLYLQRIPTMFVTWDGDWQPRHWRDPQNILHRGTQKNLLAWCNHTDRFATGSGRLRSQWSQSADQMFK